MARRNPQVSGSLVLPPREAGELSKWGNFCPKDELLGLTCARAGVAAPPAPWRGLAGWGEGLPAKGGAGGRQVAAGGRTSLGMKPGSREVEITWAPVV